MQSVALGVEPNTQFVLEKLLHLNPVVSLYTQAIGTTLMRRRQAALLPALLALAGPLAADPALQLLQVCFVVSPSDLLRSKSRCSVQPLSCWIQMSPAWNRAAQSSVPQEAAQARLTRVWPLCECIPARHMQLSSAATLLFNVRLQGLSLVESLRSLRDDAARHSAVTAALPPLFAAASAFQTEADCGNASVGLCHGLLAQLQRDTLGSVPDEGPQARCHVA